MNHVLFLIAFTLIVHFKNLRNSIILDDIPWFEKRKKNGLVKVTDLTSLINRIHSHLYGGATFGLNITLEHAFTLALNSLTACLIYVALGSNTVSFWASLLWIANPINNQLTMWLNGRRYLINVILVMLMMILPFGILLYPLTGLFQVTAFFSPILLGGWSLLAIPLLLTVCYKELREKVQTRFSLLHDDDRRKFTAKRLIIVVKDYGHYFFKMLMPGICAFTYPMHHYWGITEKGNKDAYSFNQDFARGIIALLLSVSALFIFKGSMACFWAFLCLSTLQWCAIIPVTQDLADRYASLPNVFMMFFVSYLVNTYCGVYALPILASLITYYICMLIEARKPYKGMIEYWEHARYHFPQIPAPRKYEIDHYMRTDVNKAWVLCKDGLQNNNNEFVYLKQAAVCFKIIGDFPTAKVFAEEAMKNYYVGQQIIFEPQLKMFIDSLKPPSGTIIGKPSRQVKRAEERKKSK